MVQLVTVEQVAVEQLVQELEAGVGVVQVDIRVQEALAALLHQVG